MIVAQGACFDPLCHECRAEKPFVFIERKIAGGLFPDWV